MTALEKIERCVSLVWDFQEFYGEEDIEDFCRNELHSYPQYNEILDYFKHIAELEKENAGLKTQIEKMKCCHNCRKFHNLSYDCTCAEVCNEWEIKENE